MSNLIIVDGINVRRDMAGRYCLNDLHRAAGGEERHKPPYWLRNAPNRAPMCAKNWFMPMRCGSVLHSI